MRALGLGCKVLGIKARWSTILAIVGILSVAACSETGGQIIDVKILEKEVYMGGAIGDRSITVISDSDRQFIMFGECAYGNLEGTFVKIRLASDIPTKFAQLGKAAGINLNESYVVEEVLSRKFVAKNGTIHQRLSDTSIDCFDDDGDDEN